MNSFSNTVCPQLGPGVYWDCNLTVSISDYIFIGIVGTVVAGAVGCVVEYAIKIDDTTARIRIYNASSNNLTPSTVTAACLYLKN